MRQRDTQTKNRQRQRNNVSAALCEVLTGPTEQLKLINHEFNAVTQSIVYVWLQQRKRNEKLCIKYMQSAAIFRCNA